METVRIRPVQWHKTRAKRSLVQLINLELYPDDVQDGPRRSLCGNGVKRGELELAEGYDLRPDNVCSRCLQVANSASARYVLEDGSPLLDGRGLISGAEIQAPVFPSALAALLAPTVA